MGLVTGVNATFSGDLTVDTDTLYVDSANNRVGIGTTGPSTLLDVQKNNATQFSSGSDQRSINCLTLRNANETQYTFAGISLYAGAGTGADWTIANVRQANYEGDLLFKTRTGPSGFAEKIRVKNSGNVGIGTSSPKGRMSVSSASNSGEFHVGTTGGSAFGISVLRDKDDTDDQILHFATQENSTKTRACEIEMDYTDNAMIFRNGFYNHSVYDINDANDDSNFPERMRIDSSGNLDMTNGGGNIILANGAGIDFSATANSSGTMSSELLDDYEEGSWTPVIKGSTIEGTVSYTVRVAKYVKVGKVVHIQAYIDYNSGTGTGNLVIEGLPFIAESTGDLYSSMSIAYLNNIAYTAGRTPMIYVNHNGSERLVLGQSNPAGAWSAIPYDGTGAIIFAGTYITN